MDREEKIMELERIAHEIAKFKGIEIARNANKPVPGEGDVEAKVMFIGEAPGFHEDMQGRPFIGQAGKLLEKCLIKIGMSRNGVFITNIVKYRPPDNRDPLPEEIEACKEWLDQQISVIRPKVIVTLGRFSMAKFFGPQSISRIHGIPKKMDWQLEEKEKIEMLVFPMYHPAAALRAGQVMREFENDFEKLKMLIDGGKTDINNSSGSETKNKDKIEPLSQQSLF